MSKRSAPTTTTEEIPDTEELDALFQQIMASIVPNPDYDKSLPSALPSDITDVIFDRKILTDVILNPEVILKAGITDRSYRCLALTFRGQLDAISNRAAVHYDFMLMLLNMLMQDNIANNPVLIVETYRSLLKFLNLHIPKPKDNSMGKFDAVTAASALDFLKKGVNVAPIAVSNPQESIFMEIVDLLTEIFKKVHILATVARIRFSSLYVQCAKPTHNIPDPVKKITMNFEAPALVSYSVQKTENGNKSMVFYKIDDNECIFDEIKNYLTVRADAHEDMFRDGSVFWADMGLSEMKELKKHSVMPMPGMSLCRRFALIKSIVLVKNSWSEAASIENFRPKFNSRAYTITAVEVHTQQEQFDKFRTTNNIEQYA